MSKTRYIKWFDELSLKDLATVGGKNASLGELLSLNVRVPYGFAVTTAGFDAILHQGERRASLRRLLEALDPLSLESLKKTSVEARRIIEEGALPSELANEILTAYRLLCERYNEEVVVAVRSSATAEDLPTASFAGQQETTLNLRGESALLDACRKGFSSLYTERALSYRAERGIPQGEVKLSLGVQKMVRSDLGSSGVMFTIDPESGFRGVVLIHGIFGLGEALVQGLVSPDEFVVFKPTLEAGFKPILTYSVGKKELAIRYDSEGSGRTKTVRLSPSESALPTLTEEEILTLARWGCLLEKHYGSASSPHADQASPLDIEWAKDGVSGELFIVQARPETVASQRKVGEIFTLQKRGEVITSGSAVGDKIGIGRARALKDTSESGSFHHGEVLVTPHTNPDFEPIMKRASAIVTDHGGRTSHAAIVSRELGIPCVVGCEDATREIQSGETITVSCSEGERGFVYRGELPYSVQECDPTKRTPTRTEVMMNLGEPSLAFRYAPLPHDGIGLARIEFILLSEVQIHPLALADFDQLSATSPVIAESIERLTPGYKDKSRFYVDTLARGIGRLAASVYPKRCVVRLSDLKTDEYAHLIGGELFEPTEQNPMLGWRGASRYTHPQYRRAFELECAALKKVRDEFGLTNIELMVPFCRTVEEGRDVLRILASQGLKTRTLVMCELPANALLAEEFLRYFDGFSIGSNDLTQLTLGIDRDSERLSTVFNEENEAVLLLIHRAIQVAKKHGKTIGICGDAPSSRPHLLELLVRWGIDSVSLSPDVIVKGRRVVAEEESRVDVLQEEVWREERL